MGLDMYLYRKNNSGKKDEVMYWRKANPIHNWFVQNIQGDNDDCGVYEVSKDELKELLNLCEIVLSSCELVEGFIKNGQWFKDGKLEDIVVLSLTIEDPSIAKELLPTKAGFFFGSLEYNKFYYEDILYTRDELKKLLSKDENCTYVYTSSW